MGSRAVGSWCEFAKLFATSSTLAKLAVKRARELQAPRPQNRPFLRNPKIRVRRFVESVTQHFVSAFADNTLAISMSPNRAGL
jgi:hypothetical protein